MSERIYDGQIERPDWELIHKAFEDISQWLRDAPTPEMKKYRMGVISEAFSGRRMQSPWHRIEINEEWDRGENPFALDRRLLGE